MAFRLRSPRRVGYSLKTHLYSIIAFLGLLPLLGVAVALLVFDITSRDNAALDRAARGTIYLERVNGLIYAVVMESRGIYLSADWKTAEPFAKNLLRDLPELQQLARTWTAEALASQQSNVEELAREIDQFVQFERSWLGSPGKRVRRPPRSLALLRWPAPRGMPSRKA